MIVTVLSGAIRTNALSTALPLPGASMALAKLGKPNVNSSPPPAAALTLRKARREAPTEAVAASEGSVADLRVELRERRRCNMAKPRFLWWPNQDASAPPV